jgi:hypothetical protein
MEALQNLVVDSKDKTVVVPKNILEKLPYEYMMALKRQIHKKKVKKLLEKNKKSILDMAENTKTCVPTLTKQEFPDDHKREKREISCYYENSTFENQREFAQNILDTVQETNGAISQILALAPTQSGKTGTMLACVHKFVNESCLMPWNHVFVFTPLSSKDWLFQTKQRFPKCLNPNIYHRNHTNKLMQKLKNIIEKEEKNILLIIDEAHVACKYDQTLYHMYKTLGLYDRNVLYKNNIKILMFTATPCGIETAALREDLPWKTHTKVLTMNVPSSYVSIEDYEQKGIIKPSQDLCGYDQDTKMVDPSVYGSIVELLQFVSFDDPKFHIIRTKGGKEHKITIQNFMNLLKSQESPCEEKIQKYKNQVPQDLIDKVGLISEPTIPAHLNFDMNQLFDKKPKKNYFIFIKDKLRCAKTINTSHIGVLYERKVKKPKYSTMAQGLAGRATGIQKSSPRAIFVDTKACNKSIKNFLDFMEEAKNRKSDKTEPEPSTRADAVSQ